LTKYLYLWWTMRISFGLCLEDKNLLSLISQKEVLFLLMQIMMVKKEHLKISILMF